jgi:hypothetical protein
LNVIRCFLTINCRTNIVTRYVDGKKANLARLPARLDGWVLAEMEAFRIYGPPKTPTHMDPQTA